MTSYAQQILRQYPVRRSEEEKQRFRDYLVAEGQRLGYRMAVERDGKCANVTAGETEQAPFILAAHYDTCPNRFFPGLIAPGNPLLMALSQIVFPLLLMVLMFLAAFAAGFAMNKPGIVFPLWCLLLVLCLFALRYGPANRHNSNDNTSGVAAVLAIMAACPAEARKNAAFVFLDGNYESYRGARKYRKRHDASEGQTVFSFDCVGDGDELLFCPSKYSRWDGEMLNAIVEAAPPSEEKHVLVKDQGFCFFPSDQRKFHFSVGVGAFHKTGGVGYWVGRLNTAKDTVLEEENIAYLARHMSAFLLLGGRIEAKDESADGGEKAPDTAGD